MAILIRDPNGRKRIQFVDANGARKTIRLGEVALRQAGAVKVKVEALVAALTTHTSPDPEISRWVSGLDDVLHSRVGLVTPRTSARTTVGGLLDTCFSTLSVKDGTATTYQQTRRSLEAYFGAGVPIDTVTALEAERWRRWLRDSQHLAEATISKRIKTARQLFKRAVKWKMTAENPFVEVRAGLQTNKARMFFINPEVTGKVLEACPDAEWRTIVALSRYGGLRGPSEHLALRWQDVDWDQGRLTVWSAKTAGHEGGEFRVLPLFRELRPVLLEAFEQAAPGTEVIITRSRDPGTNLRTQFLRILARSGVTPWPRLFHNLRSSRQTELCETYPAHVVSTWLGNSVVVAQAHYLQVLDAHFEKAAAPNPATAAKPVRAEAAQIAAQSAAVLARTDRQSHGLDSAQGAPVPRDTAPYETVPFLQVTPWGFEPQFPG